MRWDEDESERSGRMIHEQEARAASSGEAQRKLKNDLILKVVIISILPGFGNNYTYLL